MIKLRTSLLRAVASSAVVGLVLLGVGDACNYVTNTTAVQCLDEKQCRDIGPEFKDYTCNAATKTCVPIVQGEGLCTKNQECIDKNGGAPAICRKSDQRCVVLKTAECDNVYGKPGEIANDNAVIIGEIDPANTSKVGLIFNKVVQLVQEDVSTNVGGFPETEPGKGIRPLVIVTCQEFGAGIEGVQRAATHLAKDIGVPAVLGPLDSQNVIATAGPVFLPNRIMDMPPTAVLSALNDLPNPAAPTQLIWRPAISDVVYAKATASFVSDALAQKTIDMNIRKAGEPLRVAIFSEGNIFGKSLTKHVTEVLNFNGKDAAANAADGNFRAFDFGDQNDPTNNPDPGTKISRVIGDVYAYKPHVVIHASNILTLPRAFFPLEKNWPTDGSAGPKPIHISVSGTWAQQTLYDFIGKNADLQKRVFTTSPVSFTGDQRRSQFSLRFFTRFPEFSGEAINALTLNVYDAAYLMVYAIAAVGNKQLTGENIAQAMLRLQPPGTPIVNEPDTLAEAFKTLATGANLDPTGLSGPLDFDPKEGGVKGNAQIICPVLGGDGAVTSFDVAGYVYDQVGGTGGTFTDPTKKLSCP